MICLHGYDRPEQCRQCPQDAVKAWAKVRRCAAALVDARRSERLAAGHELMVALDQYERAESYRNAMRYGR